MLADRWAPVGEGGPVATSAPVASGGLHAVEEIAQLLPRQEEFQRLIRQDIELHAAAYSLLLMTAKIDDPRVTPRHTHHKRQHMGPQRGL